jgi:hypothetical protein
VNEDGRAHSRPGLPLDPLDLLEFSARTEPMWLAPARNDEQFVVAEDLGSSLLTATQERD